MDITLYAQPKSDEPHVLLFQLKRGVYMLHPKRSLRYFIRLSDIGENAWKTANSIYPDAEIRLLKYSVFEEDKSWNILITTPDFTCLLRRIRYKPLGERILCFFISMHLKGDPWAISRFTNEFVKNLGRDPYDIDDWDRFTRKTSLTRDYVIKGWDKCMNYVREITSSVQATVEAMRGVIKETKVESILSPETVQKLDRKTRKLVEDISNAIWLSEQIISKVEDVSDTSLAREFIEKAKASLEKEDYQSALDSAISARVKLKVKESHFKVAE